jgi:DNA uptake protein ComE-like DNA-binding protein
MQLKHIILAALFASGMALPVAAQTIPPIPATPAVKLPTAPPMAALAPVNVNTASAAELDKLPGVGTARS